LKEKAVRGVETITTSRSITLAVTIHPNNPRKHSTMIDPVKTRPYVTKREDGQAVKNEKAISREVRDTCIARLLLHTRTTSEMSIHEPSQLEMDAGGSEMEHPR
jgi:hypothetical protein